MIPLVNRSTINNDLKVIVLPTCNGVLTIDTSTIIHVRSMSNYSKLFFSDGKTLVVAKVLAWFEDRLPATSFVRIHRSHIIGLQHVQTWCDTGNSKIILCNDTVVDVSRRKRGTARKAFRNLYAA